MKYLSLRLGEHQFDTEPSEPYSSFQSSTSFLLTSLLLKAGTLLRQLAHLNEHFDARYPLEGQQQEGHEGQPLALRRLLETSDDCSKLNVVLPVGTHTCMYIATGQLSSQPLGYIPTNP